MTRANISTLTFVLDGPKPIARRRRAFSLMEMLLALAISATLLTAMLSALDSSFKGYKQTTETASTHVISRIVMHRLLAMVRTGVDFGPFPADVLDKNQNPVASDFFEFVSQRDYAGGVNQVTRIEFRPGANQGDPGELWYVILQPQAPTPLKLEERPLISGVLNATFTLSYDIGPKLKLATIDLTIAPNDSQDIVIGADATPQTIRLVASASPRQLQ